MYKAELVQEMQNVEKQVQISADSRKKEKHIGYQSLQQIPNIGCGAGNVCK